MSMLLKGEHDKDILRYIENVGMCTANQIAKIFYSNKSQGNAIARRRLRKMVDYGYLKIKTFDKMNNRNVYIFNSKKFKKMKPSLHRLFLLDYHAELFYNKAKVIYFKMEQEWLNGDIRSDGFCVYSFNDKFYYDAIEIITSYNDRKLDKYNILYESDQIYEVCNGNFPRVILIDDYNVTDSKLNPNIKLIRLDYELKPFTNLFI